MKHADLLELLQEPTAPYREMLVRAWIERFCDENQLPHFRDSVGNVVLGAVSEADVRARLEKARSEKPIFFFIAHMDHPGFHGVELKKNRLAVKWFGGSPVKALTGTKVWLANRSGYVGHGKIRSAKLASHKRAIDSAVVELPKGFVVDDPRELFGGFAFRKPAWRAGKKIYTKAADDLVGAFAILQIALSTKKTGNADRFLAVLTRAEEVGFIGAIGHFALGWMEKHKTKVICVSLETSRTLPGALVGAGPVVRLGDRATIFDPGSVNRFAKLAAKLLPGKHQKRVMDGGTCEGTVAMANQFPTIAISIPLGNYHNQGFEGGPDCRVKLGPAPEFVHLDDVGGMIRLGSALVSDDMTWADPWQELRDDFKARFAEATGLLAENLTAN